MLCAGWAVVTTSVVARQEPLKRLLPAWAVVTTSVVARQEPLKRLLPAWAVVTTSVVARQEPLKRLLPACHFPAGYSLSMTDTDLSAQQEPTRIRQRARFSTDWPAGSTLPPPEPGRQASHAALSANQWTMLILVGVFLFVGLALASGVVVGRAFIGTSEAPAAMVAPATPREIARSEPLVLPSSLRVDPRPSVAVGDSAVSLLLGHGPRPGDEAPAFKLKTLGGGALSADDLRGRPLVLNFWATWCTWCKYELPALEAVYEKYRNRGLVVVGVDVEEPPPLVEAYAERYGLSFPVLLDEAGETASTYDVRGLPMTYFVDEDGIIVRIQRGAMREDELELYARSVLPAR